MKTGASRLKKISYGLLAAFIALILLEAGSRLIMKKIGRGYLAYMPMSFSRGREKPAVEKGGIISDPESGKANPVFPDVMNFLPKNPGIKIRFNRDGLRNPDVPLIKAENELRILTLGNSCVFGYGVEEDSTFSGQLEKLLQDRFPEKKIKVINGGMPGFSSYNCLNLLGVAGMKYNPDIMIAYILNNDKVLEPKEDMPFLKHRLQRLNWALSRSGLFKLMKALVYGIRTSLPQGRGVKKQKLKPKVSPEDYERNLKRLAEISSRSGIKLYYAIPPAPSDFILDRAELEKFIYFNAEGERIRAAVDKKRLIIRESVRKELSEAAVGAGPSGISEGLINRLAGKRLAETGVEAAERKKNMASYERYNFYMDKYRGIMKKVSSDCSVELIDLPSAIKGEPGLRALDFFLDEVHPSPYGHRIIAEQLCGKIASDMSRPASAD